MATDKYLISIIVPVYQVENYVGECLKSILNQTYKHLEVICVDDGSTDDSGKICDEYAAADSRVKVIHTKNRGAGAARNTALQHAVGQYIGFVDADDFIDPTMYEELMRIILEYRADIVSCEYREIYIDTVNERPITNQTELFSASEFLIRTTEHWTYYIMCNKLFHREIISSTKFPEGNIIDDVFFTYRIIGRAQRIAYYSRALYNYRQRQNSAMQDPNHRLTIDREAMRIDRERLKYIRENYPDILGIFQRKMLNNYITVIRNGRITAKEKDDAVIFMRHNCDRALFHYITFKESLYFLAYMYIPFMRRNTGQICENQKSRTRKLFP